MEAAVDGGLSVRMSVCLDRKKVRSTYRSISQLAQRSLIDLLDLFPRPVGARGRGGSCFLEGGRNAVGCQ
jgi:hypothetical protein